MGRLERRLLVKSIRNMRNGAMTRINRKLGREFIPGTRRSLSIETSSLCNLDCAFCAYPKKQSPRVVMSNAFFQDCVVQALDMGYDTFDLTPCTGEVFMDRHLFDKLAFLDSQERVKQYDFFSNFSVPTPDHIEALHTFKKLGGLAISVYGHDLDTFREITKSTETVYLRLVKNLELLLRMKKEHGQPVFIIFHSAAESLRGRSSGLITVIDQLERAGCMVNRQKGLYNNWGGFVSDADVKLLPFKIVGPDVVRKNGACVRLITAVQITATGIVNGCGARDTDTTLRLGDLHTTRLRDIISARNPAYMSLIEEQQNGDFRPVCRSCDFYTSIYHKSLSYDGAPLQSLAEFKASLP